MKIIPKRVVRLIRSLYSRVHQALLPDSMDGPTNEPNFPAVLQFIDQSVIIVGPYPAFPSQTSESLDIQVFSKSAYSVRVSSIEIPEMSPFVPFQASTRSSGALTISSHSGFSPLLSDNFRNHRLYAEELSEGWNFFEVVSPEGLRSFPILIPRVNCEDILFVESTDTMLAYGVDLVGEDFESQLESGFDIPTYYHRNPTFNFFRADPYPLQFERPNFDRPYPKDHLIAADHFLKKLVARATDCEPDFAGDDYADDFENIRNYKMIVLGAHNEYWTDTKFRNLNRFIGEGGKLLVLGGNTAWRRVVRTDRGTFIYGNGYFYEKGAHDLLGSSLGGQEDHGFRNLRPSHHIMKDVPREFARVATVSTGNSFPTNGHETDRISSTEFELLAAGPKDQGAHLVYRRFESGGEVLKFGAVSLWLAYEDKGLEQVVRNFFTESL